MTVAPHRLLSRSFLATAALLATHEVDSGYWREWDLFRIPGGVGLFLLLHVGIFLLLFWGYGQVHTGTRAGTWMSFVVAGGALFAGAAHGAFLLLGRSEFRSPISMGVLLAVTAGGVVLLIASVSVIRRPTA
ncbi:DUF6713 family protein [Anaeromyxobacter oryzisoli]|uniref:DUF6713 family protein n=1 Tax=Anaeromyxobacter oryzisoli TaxID=2925408 RepID=UPI001F5AD84E|nr:DUF6713 family protein [Anaeromyxobacter sp. SG63]